MPPNDLLAIPQFSALLDPHLRSCSFQQKEIKRPTTGQCKVRNLGALCPKGDVLIKPLPPGLGSTKKKRF